MFDGENNSIDLSTGANQRTIGGLAGGVGVLALLALALYTGIHAVNLALWNSAIDPSGGDLAAIMQIGGVVLVEVFAVTTAIMLLTNRLRASQKPAAMVIEFSWLAFAALNLIGSFAIERTAAAAPAFVNMWVTYGLPISALIIGAEFWLMLRLSPEHRRADDIAEIADQFEAAKHAARLEVLASPQMRSVIRQAAWQQTPAVIGRQMNLTEEQIANLVNQAPALLDLNGDKKQARQWRTVATKRGSEISTNGQPLGK